MAAIGNILTVIYIQSKRL